MSLTPTVTAPTLTDPFAVLLGTRRGDHGGSPARPARRPADCTTARAAVIDRASDHPSSRVASYVTDREQDTGAMRVESYNRYSATQGAPVESLLPEFEGLLVEFGRDLTDDEQRQAAGAICYWAKLPQHFGGSTTNDWLTARHFWIDCASENTSSRDWRAREPFAALVQYTSEGTPQRKRQNDTRAFEGVGIAPERVILGHPGDKAPRAPQAPVDWSRADARGPALTGSPYDLLRMP